VLHLEGNVQSRGWYAPRYVPKDLAPRLTKLTQNPLSWFYGQLNNFIHYTEFIENMVLDYKKKIGFKSPIAGIHIRRTDRVKKERYIPVEKYMEEIEDYFDKLEITQSVKERRVFLATDAKEVVAEIKNKYPNYKFILVDDEQSFRINRWSDLSLWLIIVNIRLLGMCDFVVCTYSSSVCRVINMHLQQRNLDILTSIKSLQFVYFVMNENDRNGIAILDHEPSNYNETEIKKGDLLIIPWAQWSIYSYIVHNHRTKRKGFVPAFKIEITVDTFDGPPFL
jgi:glycoprotein 6-alpha-L-fucosyltransferase